MPKKVIGIVPARFGSTRFPGKPLIPILGKTLIQRTYENACRACLDEVIVATDDDRIYNHVKGFGGKVVMTPASCPTGTDRIAEVLKLHPHYLESDVIVNIQGDEPVVDPSAIDSIVDLLLETPDLMMSTAVTSLVSQEEAKNSSIVKCVIDKDNYALYFSRSLIPGNKKLQYDSTFPFLRHIGLYAFRPSFVVTYQNLPATPLQLIEDLEHLKVLEHGFRIKVAKIPHNSPGVDTPEDIKKVEQWLCKQNTSL